MAGSIGELALSRLARNTEHSLRTLRSEKIGGCSPISGRR